MEEQERKIIIKRAKIVFGIIGIVFLILGTAICYGK